MTSIMTDLTSLEYFNSELKDQMNAFSSVFNQKVTQGKNDLFINKDKFVKLINDIQTQQNDLLAQLETLNKRSADLEKQDNEELQDLENAKAKNEELLSQREIYEKSKAELKSKIDDLNNKIALKRQEITHLNEKLEENKNLSLIEFNKYESYLGLKIDGLKPDLLKFNFRNVDVNDYNKIVSFRLDVSDKYKVLDTDPILSGEEVALIEGRFNEHKDLGKFLKEMRFALSKA